MTGQTPYETVYLHGLVRNEAGRKISKSMEDIEEYDPLKIIDRYGADALRYTLLTSATPGLDMNLDPRRLENARNFTNKVWQAARFVLMNAAEADTAALSARVDAHTPGLTLPDRWILSRLNRLADQVSRLFEGFQYGEAGRQIYDFLWGEYCDWYIEAAKVRLYGDEAGKSTTQVVLIHVLETALRLLHPFTPFFTEAIWQALPKATDAFEALMISRWPEADLDLVDNAAETSMTVVMDLIRGIRHRRTEYDVTPGKRIPAFIAAEDRAVTLDEQRQILCALARLDPDSLVIARELVPPERAASVVVGDVIAYLPLAGMVDLAAEREHLEAELAKVEARASRSRELLAGPFAERAPAQVVLRERDKLAELRAEADTLSERLAALR
jgi:valyl-tRNA synthetase